VHKYKLVSLLFLSIVLAGYAFPLTFSTIVTGDSPVAKDNLIPRTKVTAEQDNVDSFDVHPANRWLSSETAGITSSITDGNLKVVAPEDNTFQISRRLFESDGEVDYRYGVDYTNDSLLTQVNDSYYTFEDEWFDNVYSDLNDWSEGDLDNWISNDSLSIFSNHYLKVLNDDGTYYYKSFDSLFDGHLPDPRSTPFTPRLIPKEDYNDENGGTIYGQEFEIPEGQEWFIEYLAYNLGQYNGVDPCLNINVCVDNGNFTYVSNINTANVSVGEDPLFYTKGDNGSQTNQDWTLDATTNSMTQIFEVPAGETWNVTGMSYPLMANTFGNPNGTVGIAGATDTGSGLEPDWSDVKGTVIDYSGGGEYPTFAQQDWTFASAFEITAGWYAWFFNATEAGTSEFVFKIDDATADNVTRDLYSPTGSTWTLHTNRDYFPIVNYTVPLIEMNDYLELNSTLTPTYSYTVTDNLTESNSQWVLDSFNPSHVQIFEVPTDETWYVTDVGYALAADRSGSPEGLIGITETINGSYISEGGTGSDVISYIPDWSNVLTSGVTGSTGHVGIGTVSYESWKVTPVSIPSGIYAWFWNDTKLDGSSYYLKYDGVDSLSNQTNDFFAQDGTEGWLGEGGIWWWDYFPVINYTKPTELTATSAVQIFNIPSNEHWTINKILYGNVSYSGNAAGIIGVVGLTTDSNGEFIADWSDIKSSLVIGNLTTEFPLASNENFTLPSVKLATGYYGIFWNTTGTGSYYVTHEPVGNNTRDLTIFNTTTYNTSWYLQPNMDFFFEANYTLLTDDFTPIGEIGIAGVNVVSGFNQMDITNIYWNTSIGNLATNNSWNYFATGESLNLSAGTYIQYINVQANFTTCDDGGGCAGEDPRRYYSNGYLLYSDIGSPEDLNNGNDNERESLYQYGRYADTAFFDTQYDYYFGVNYSDIYNCDSFCINVSSGIKYYNNSNFPLIEEFSRDVYSPRWELSGEVTINTSDHSIYDSVYSTFRIPETETWEISSISLYGYMNTSSSNPTADWFITDVIQCVWGSTCNNVSTDPYLGGLEQAYIPDMGSILASGTTNDFTTSLVWQNISLGTTISLTTGAYAIVFNDTSSSLDGDYFVLYSDTETVSQQNVTQTGTHNTSLSYDWYIESPDVFGSWKGKDLRFQIHYNNSEIDAATFNKLEVYFNSSEAITNILINDFDGNQVCTDSTGWSANTWYKWECDLSLDADWGKHTEHGLQFNFTSALSSLIELGNVTLWSNYVQISRVGESITAGASGYNNAFMIFNASTRLTNLDWIDSDGNNACPQYEFEEDFRYEYICQLNYWDYWQSTETEINLRFTFNSTTPLNTEYVLIDYLFLFKEFLPHDFFANNYTVGNALNFDDGTLEGVYGLSGEVETNDGNGYIIITDSAPNSMISATKLIPMNGDVYKHLYIRFYPEIEIDYIEVFANTGTLLVCTNSTNHAAGVWHQWYCDLGLDPDWDTVETGFNIRFHEVSAGYSFLRIDYILLLTNATSGDWQTWIASDLDKDFNNAIPIPNGTNSFMRFYLYPENRGNRQIYYDAPSLVVNHTTNFYTLFLTNISVNSGNNSFEIGFLSTTTGMNWIDFNTSIYDSNLTDSYHFNDLNTTQRNIVIQLWNTTGWEGIIEGIWINVTDSNLEQTLDIGQIRLDTLIWTHNPDIVYGFWDNDNSVPLLDVKHSILSYWTFNATFRIEITMYNSTGGISAYYNSPAISIDTTLNRTTYYRVHWDYTFPESNFEIIFFDDGNNEIWESNYGTDFTLIDSNPKIFNTGGLVPSLYYNVTTETDEPVTAWTDYINAQYKEREWRETYNNVTNPNWDYQTPQRNYGNNSGDGGDGLIVGSTNMTQYQLSINNLDSVSGTISADIDLESGTSSADLVIVWFRLYNVDWDTGDLVTIFEIFHSIARLNAPDTRIWKEGAVIFGRVAPSLNNGNPSGVEFSVSTREDRRYVDANFRHHDNMSDDTQLKYDAFTSVDMDSDVRFTRSQEFVAEMEYHTFDFGEDDGRFDMRLSEFAYTSAGWLEDIAQAILSPIVGALSFLLKALWDIFVAIFTPLIMFLAWILTAAFSVLGRIFEIAIGAVGLILDGLGIILDGVLGILDDLWEWISEFLGAIAVILVDFLGDILNWLLTDVVPWIVAQMLFIWGTIAEGIFNIIDPSGGLSSFFAGLFANDAAEIFVVVFNVIALVTGLITWIWIIMTFYIFTSPAFQAEGDANRYVTEFFRNAGNFHGVTLSIIGFNIPIHFPTIIWWFMLTILLGYLDWVTGGIQLF
jgi:hypothetical protein